MEFILRKSNHQSRERVSVKILHDGSIETGIGDRKQIFDRTFASLAWPEESAGHMIVCGMTPDGRLVVFTECAGGLLELGDMAIRAKNDHAIDSVIVDDRDRVSTVGLRNLEGLCFDDLPTGASRKVLWPGGCSGKSSSGSIRDAVAVSGALKEIINNYRGALERARILIMKRLIVIDETQCPTLSHELFQPMSYVLVSSAVRSLVLASGSVVSGVWPERQGNAKRPLWYENMRRPKCQ